MLLLLTAGRPASSDEVLAALQGELVTETVGAFRDRVFPLLDPAPTRLVLDVSRVTALGRAGVRTLVALRRKCTSAGVHLVLRSPSLPVRRRLTDGHLDPFFEIEN
ncbi:MAG: hypothetical protein QOG60_720 [Frankiaceae bacterium]|nr:hypothetical protein [Frankiaceae bacterium]MDQ1671930.1 hypothetical protein [Frankiaceae bacterium]